MIDLRSGTTRTLPTSLDLRGASLRPNASQLALSVGREVQLWDSNLLAKAASYVNPSEVGAAVWSSDGMRFAVGTASGSVFLWDMANGQCQSLGGHTEPLRSLIFSPDNTLLLTAAWDNTTRLWDVRSGHSLLTCEGELGSDFSEDGQRIGFARSGVGVGVWRLESSPVLRTLQPWLGGEAKIRHFDLSGSGRWLAAVVNGDVHLWDLARTAPASIVTIGDVATVTFHPDEQSILLCRSGGLEFRRLDTDPASPLPVVGPPRSVDLPDGSRPRQATISLDGRTILVEWENLSFTIVDGSGSPSFTRWQGRKASVWPCDRSQDVGRSSSYSCRPGIAPAPSPHRTKGTDTDFGIRSWTNQAMARWHRFSSLKMIHSSSGFTNER